MLARLISNDWYFSENYGPYQKIDLPHDYAITKNRDPHTPGGTGCGYYPSTPSRYVKHLSLEKGRHYVLCVDGAYMCAEVFFNENHLGIHPHGYTPFLTDLTPYVLDGVTNKLKIALTPLPASTRWYSGNGIYRDVFLYEGGSVRIEPWDLFITTEKADASRAEILASYTLSSDQDTEVSLRFSLLSPTNEILLTEEKTQKVRASKTDGSHVLSLAAPLFWSPDSPALYTLRTEIFEGERLLDTTEEEFGIRTVTANAEEGLLLNGQAIKLRGGCIHHDNGVLGAMAYPTAEERKIALLKKAGFNAIRTAHNPPSLALLRACDRQGMLVMDEAFDCWQIGKMPRDYHLFFADRAEEDVVLMVRRDRNHPSVISYSIGNEIGEIDGTEGASYWARTLTEAIKRHDSTRFVTSGIQKDFVGANKKGEDIDPDDYKSYLHKTYREIDARGVNAISRIYEDPLDIVGCNYYYDRYEVDHECDKTRILWGSETQVLSFQKSWAQVEKHPYVLGDFTWTACDNLGEVGAGRLMWARDGSLRGLSILGSYPWRACYQGDLDLIGDRRPQSYFREAVWLGAHEGRIFVTHPEHFGEPFTGTGWHFYDVCENWSYDACYEGQPITVETYVRADLVRWYVNGEAVGESVPDGVIARLDTVYHRGEIRADVYRAGELLSSYTLASNKAACRIDLTPEKKEIKADGRELLYVQISLIDRDGCLDRTACHELSCTVTGGELLGVFSADPANEDLYGSNACHAFGGRALAVIRAKTKGKITLTVHTDGLAAASTHVLARQ